MRVFGLVEWIEENPLQRPKEVYGGEYHSRCGNDRQPRVAAERSNQDEEFTFRVLRAGGWFLLLMVKTTL